MEHTSKISPAVPEIKPVKFDSVEIAGLIVPLLFAILTIVLVAMNPNPSGTAAAAKDAKAPQERLERIQQR
ncbi:hypothetical protein [Marinobacter sp. CHS3-4]|uniref:hypothetical protein n=1 Tax=Marinobacter sp. CHS3-4 TaxID=3045174 RepID=UPI0024B59A88|nr:hypothetical protein [Marinobacter sp. CHS3-4]MDI9245962.1 hypothetical protein [Marinobacter sp. CHS3-4]